MEGILIEIIKQVAPTIVGAIIGYALAWLLAIKGLTFAVQMLLRKSLRQDRNYFERVGLTYEQKTDYEAMYKAYHALGKNGVMDGCFKAVMAMKPKQAGGKNGTNN